jgi:hypothetical protein
VIYLHREGPICFPVDSWNIFWNWFGYFPHLPRSICEELVCWPNNSWYMYTWYLDWCLLHSYIEDQLLQVGKEHLPAIQVVPTDLIPRLDPICWKFLRDTQATSWAAQIRSKTYLASDVLCISMYGIYVFPMP